MKTQVTENAVLNKIYSLSKKDALYMHPLPADRGYEVEDAVIDSDQSVVYDQAENRYE